MEFFRQPIQCLARRFPTPKRLLSDLESKGVSLGVLAYFQVIADIGDSFLQSRDVLLRLPKRTAAMEKSLAVLGAKPVKPHHLGIDLGLFHDQRIARRDGFDLRVGQSGGVHVLNFSDMALSAHDLADEFGLGFEDAPHIGVE